MRAKTAISSPAGDQELALDHLEVPAAVEDAAPCRIEAGTETSVTEALRDTLRGELLRDVEPGTFMYFVHSFHVELADPSVVVAYAEHGSMRFVACLEVGNLMATQFHPERSAASGLRVYRALAAMLREDRSDP